MIQGRVGCDHAFPNIYEDSFSSFSSPSLHPVLIVCPYSLSLFSVKKSHSFRLVIHSSILSVCWPLHSFTQAEPRSLLCGLHWLKPSFIASIFQFIHIKEKDKSLVQYGFSQSSRAGCCRFCLTSRCTW